jgi:hypothetical protein
MNPKLKIGSTAIPVWMLLLGLIAAASLAISVQPVDNEKINLEHTDGEIHTNVPVAGTRQFTGLPVEFDRDNEVNFQWRNAVSVGTKILTSQRILFNVMTDVGEEAELLIPLVNNSEDSQIVQVNCDAPRQVYMDLEIPAAADSPGIDAIRIVGFNQWIVNVKDGLAGPPGAPVGTMELVINTPHAGAYPIECKLLAVG